MNETFKEYPNKKTFVIVHYTGTGVMEDPSVMREIVFDTDDKQEAEDKAHRLYLDNNSLGQIQSTWTDNHYHIHTNPLTEEGKRLETEFRKQFDEAWSKRNPDDYNEYKVGDITFSIEKSAEKHFQNLENSGKKYKSIRSGIILDTSSE